MLEATAGDMAFVGRVMYDSVAGGALLSRPKRAEV